ncbi:MAG TPA: hypothetical protein DF296_06355 [Candidatus Margulisbacteria bacterium]|nr:MAG: hypothetical protein A2X41_04630 [Candidatus Margulisbacteria bacterium GWE2_39_32]HCT84804.1 hypothetical protein [Candidatus Margulisiibacteriota bacterium]
MTDIFQGNYQGCYLGAFISPKLPEKQQYFASVAEMTSFNQLLGKNISVYVTYLSWEKDGKLSEFPIHWCNEVNAAGAIPHLTWEPWDFERSSTKYTLDKIAIGKYDEYLVSFAQDIKTYGKPLFLRWAQEMNGFWYPWDGTHNFNDPSRYVAAFRHIRSLFDQEGAHNVTWVWSPEVTGDLAMDNPMYDYHNYYPGNDYVDWIAIDGLNFGPTQNAASEWRSFGDLFGETYNDLNSSYPKKPIMIGSMGTAELGGNKAEWVIDAFQTIKSMNKIKIVTLFNIDKEANWMVNSSPESLTAFNQSIKDSYFLS